PVDVGDAGDRAGVLRGVRPLRGVPVPAGEARRQEAGGREGGSQRRGGAGSGGGQRRAAAGAGAPAGAGGAGTGGDLREGSARCSPVGPASRRSWLRPAGRRSHRRGAEEGGTMNGRRTFLAVLLAVSLAAVGRADPAVRVTATYPGASAQVA